MADRAPSTPDGKAKGWARRRRPPWRTEEADSAYDDNAPSAADVRAPLFCFEPDDMQEFDLPGLQPGFASPRGMRSPRAPKGRRGGRRPQPAWAARGAGGAGGVGGGGASSRGPPGGGGGHNPLAAPEQDDEEEILSSIQTSEDAISYFALQAEGANLKFLHLNRAETGQRFRPYDLVVVPPRNVHPLEHFTMSATGVVRVAPGEPSDMIALAEWMRQSTIFNVISQINFYKNYLIFKTFRSWRSSIRYNLYRQTRNRLSQKLFLAKPTFCEPILEIADHMHDLRGVELQDLKSMKFFEVGSFVDCQSVVRSEAVKTFESIMEKVQGVVDKVCQEAESRARSFSELSDAKSKASKASKTKSMVKIKQEQAELVRMRKRTRQEASMLGDFIRVTDFMTVESILGLTIATNKTLLTEMLSSRKFGLFEETIKFGPSSVVFEPTAVEIADMIASKTEDLITTINSVPRIIYIRPFKTYVANSTSNTTSRPVGALVRSSSVFRTIEKGIADKIRTDFEKGRDYAQQFESVRPIYEFERSGGVTGSAAARSAKASAAAVAASSAAAAAAAAAAGGSGPGSGSGSAAKEDGDGIENENGPSVASIKQQMTMVAHWEKDLEKMRPAHTIGILYIESRKLKQSLIPVCSNHLKYLKDQLVGLFRRRVGELLSEYTQRVHILEAQPSHLKEFAQHAESCKRLEGERRGLMKDAAVVDEMHRLLHTHEVKLTSEDMVQLDYLRLAQNDYNEQAQGASDYIEDKLTDMTTTLDTQIAHLNDQALSVKEQLQEGELEDDTAPPDVCLKRLEVYKIKLDKLEEQSLMYTHYQTLFGLQPHVYNVLVETQEIFQLRWDLWSMLEHWQEVDQHWHDSPFRTPAHDAAAEDVDKVDGPGGGPGINVEEMNTEVNDYFKRAYATHRAVDNRVSLKLKELVETQKDAMSIIMDLGNVYMQKRHWLKIYALIGMKDNPDPDVTLSTLEFKGINKHAEEVAEISGAASGEAGLETSLRDVAEGWEKMEFILISYRDSKDVFILGGLDDILVLLEDNQVSLQTMMGSRFIVGVRHEVERWEKKLALLSETLDEWVTCQRNWMYLETIFAAPDIQKQLPHETTKFQVVDKSWKTTMRLCRDNPLVISVVERDTPDELLCMFQNANATLESVLKSLEDYLETKRSAFPRFYFLSNDELLEILSQTRDPQAVQPHLVKCFDAMKSIKFHDAPGSTAILAMVSADGETVAFEEEVAALGPVEIWLGDIEKMMKQSLRSSMRASCQAYPEYEAAVDRDDWLVASPAQVVIAVDQIFWTKHALAAIMARQSGEGDDAVQKFLEYQVRQIDSMIRMVRGDLTKLQRKMMTAVVTIDVNKRDILRSFVATDLASPLAFDWTRQLRYYWDEDLDGCTLRQTNTFFEYGYEYLGIGTRLAITPLTDICYMTLTGALHLRSGGAPAGPAGTGKTETVKDLGKAMARQCIVFNCSDGLDHHIMGRFFSGLAQAGAWACFDEFNRIDIEVLSVIAQQILCIQQAITNDAVEFDFEGKDIPLNSNFGVFITMNPGYAGRTELPDNLKALFRPVAMMVPDYRLIAEIFLFSYGFSNALPLSNKMTQLYRLASEQLSKQDHYDFGMRAVKSVLVAAGQLKRKEPNANEDLLLIRAMRDSNVPKFLEADLPLFQGILGDLYPDMDVPFVDYGKLQEAIEGQLSKAGLQTVSGFVGKMIQVHETQLVRHGMMLVGEAGSGKSTNVRVLAKALTQLKADGVEDSDGYYQTVKIHCLNPKSITAGELYGEFNSLSGEWRDGLVPKLVRTAKAEGETSPDRQWILFDGPVDAGWIENMNTVLDDNKLLCLANSERIKLPDALHIMFEVEDLKVASPATVSRCGMVYMEQVHIGVAALVQTWGQKVLLDLVPDADQREHLLHIVNKYVVGADEFLDDNCKENVPSSPANRMQSCLNLMASLINRLKEARIAARVPKEQRDSFLTPKLAEVIFVFSFVWSYGANVDDSGRGKFNEFALALFRPGQSGVGDTSTDIYSLCVDFEQDDGLGGFTPWDDLRKPFEYDAKVPYFGILVPTVETTRYRYLVDALVTSQCHVLLMGETGVGKSCIIQTYLDEIVSTQKYVSATVNYSAQTNPSNLRDVFESKLEKKRKKLIAPPAGKHMIMFIDDLNMPALEIYGAQPPNELLRQAIDQGGYYDVEKLFFKHMNGVTFASACAPPGGGRNEVSARLVRHFNMVWLTDLSSESMMTIFDSILCGFIAIECPQYLNTAKELVRASVDIYRRVQNDLLPTPTKSHYTFNLRDLSKTFQGIIMIESKNLPEREDFVKLWLHEEMRVFRDRLVDNDDRNTFNALCCEMLSEHAEIEWQADQFSNLLFGDYINPDTHEYKEVPELGPFSDVLHERLEVYNVTFPTQMHLVFFNDAMYHISRLCRVLRQPRGNALLVGVGGSGRQSLTRLATFMADFACFSIEITRSYGKTEWREDLKKVLMTAGAENKPITFLFSDTQIVMELFLEDINNVLNAGEVPNLFEHDETEQIVTAVRPIAKAAGIVETRDAILAHFVYLVRDNLRLVLTFSPVGASFRNRCRMFPSLVNCCTVDWFDPWPEDALLQVSTKLLDEAKQSLGIESMVDKLGALAVKIHSSVKAATTAYYAELHRYNHTTPTSYLELIKLYVSTLRTQRDLVQARAGRYRTGLQKLAETEALVSGLQEDLVKLQPTLDKATTDTTLLLEQLEVDQKTADVAAALAAKDEAAASEKAEEVSVIAADCQSDLDQALPAYYDALKALESLDKASITEMKGFTNPPPMVAYTMEAVCILLGSKTDWKSAKTLLTDLQFLEKLKKYDKDKISSGKIRKLGKYVKNPDFIPDKVAKISFAAKSLCMWVRAMHKYDAVAKGIEPKKAKLAQAEQDLAQVQALLAEKQAALKEVQARVAELKATFEAKLMEKDSLERQKQTTVMQLARAEQLVGGLADEKVRWEEAARVLEGSLRNLVGDMALSSGCISYGGPFTMDFRLKLTQEWVAFSEKEGIPVDPKFSLTQCLAEPVLVREWNIQGLPADEFSTENGIIATTARRWPLMIDPQGQANAWVKNVYSDRNLQVIKLTDGDYLRTLENAIRFGAPVLLENVQETLDPALEPVLLKQTFKRGGQWLLRLGDTDVPYSSEFRFFITTKLANPHYLPEVCIKVTIINFTVTLRGLEEQLLVDVCRHERPDLEAKKDELVVSIAEDKKQLKEIQDKILHFLANSSGNILDDEELIDTLGASKVTSEAIGVRVTEAEQTQAAIDVARAGYRTVATRGSVIYFVIASLAEVDPMYQYSLQFFSKLYNMRIEKSEKNDDLDTRLQILIDDITLSMYTNICRGLFEKDKLLFSFKVAEEILKNAGGVSGPEWNFFMVGAADAADGDPPAPWIPRKCWQALGGLEKLPSFAGLRGSMLLDDAATAAWKKYLESEAPETSELPAPWARKLTVFQRLCVLRACRESRVVFAAREFVDQTLGRAFVESPAFDLEGAFEGSTNTTPLIFVLSPGADVTEPLMQLAAKKGKEGSALKMISLGQGQGPVAMRLIECGRQDGDWVCLQNCHLAVSILDDLEHIVEETSKMGNDVHEDYRLWLTSMPSPKFPVPILQNGIKITNEPPKGIRANLKRSFQDVSAEDWAGNGRFDDGSTKQRAWRKLLFGLCFYNALSLERRKFGAIGWNKFYGWMNSDLKTSIMQVGNYLEEQEETPWQTLNVMVGEISFGGRITEMWDKRTNRDILSKFFTPEILDDAYRFSESGEYYAPAVEGPLSDVLTYIDELPLVESPEIFSLHKNADITLQQKETKEMFDTLYILECGGGAGDGEGADAEQTVISIADRTEERLPLMPFDRRRAHPSTFHETSPGSVNSMGVFCGQEMTRFNGLVAVIRRSLIDLKRAIKGLVVMSSALEDMYNCFMFGRVPKPWENAGYPCLKVRVKGGRVRGVRRTCTELSCTLLSGVVLFESLRAQI